MDLLTRVQKNHWTAAHIAWLKALKPEGLYVEILSEYLLTYQTLSDKLERLDARIEELAADPAYFKAVKKLCCFLWDQNARRSIYHC